VENTQWHSLVAFGQTAEQCEQYLHKGRQIAIEGRLNTRSWDDKGQRRHITEVIVDRVTFLGRRDDAGATDDRDDPEHDGDRGDNGRPPPSGPHAGPPPQVTDDLPF
jgi:single-strand DNA-binding protein